ncbi:cytidine deaminase [Profundicola chukchiensis]
MYLSLDLQKVMTKKKVSFEYEEITSIEACDENIQSLYNEAQKAKEKAYAPYSNFKVGAALLLENGEVFTGNNQENAAYPSGLCAERVAIFSAKSKYPDVAIKSLVIVTSAKNVQAPVSPCGSCRQVLLEYEFAQKKPFDIYLQTKGQGLIKVASANHLLPFSFNSDMLNG